MYNDCYSGWQNHLREAGLNLDFYLDAQFTSEEADTAKVRNRNLLVINKLKRQIRLLEGYEIRNRHILKISPVGREDDVVSRQMTAAVMQLMATANGYDCVSEAFKWGSLVTGSNLVELWKDRAGNLQFNRRGYNSFLLNPTVTKSDLSDCPDILTGAWITKDSAASLVPTADLDDIPPTTSSIRWEDIGNPFIIQSGKMRLYEEWWKRETEYEQRIVHKVTGQDILYKDFVAKFAGGDSKEANRWIVETKLPNGMPALSKYKKPRSVIKLAIFIDGQFVWDGENPLGLDDYNFVWMHGEFCPEHNRDDLKLQAFLSTLRDPQTARNRKVNQALDIIESSLQAYKVVRSDKLENYEDVYKSGQGVVLHVKEKVNEALSLSEIFRQVPGAEPGQGIFGLMESLDKDLTDVGGLNEEIFGSDDKDIPGILHKYRTGQALTGQAGLFSCFRAAKKQLGIKVVKAIQHNYSPQMVQRIINEMPVPEFYTPDLSQYDCVPTEGLLTDTQQELFYAELKGLRTAFPDMAQVITPVDLIQASPIQFKKELLDIIAQRQKQLEQTQAKAVQDQQAMTQLVAAQTQADIARSVKDMQAIDESKADTALTRVKTAAEINDLKTAPILELIKLAVDLEKSKMPKEVVGTK